MSVTVNALQRFKEEIDVATVETDTAGLSSGVSEVSTLSDCEGEVGDYLQFLRPAVRRAFLVRHGETDFNADGRIQGTLESQLTEKGRSQARETGAWLATAAKQHGFDRVLVSPKDRTMQTLDEIEGELNKAGHVLPPREQRFDLREIELTPWEGMRRVEIKEADAAAWEEWKKRPCEFEFATGHAPLQDLYERAGSEWEYLHDTTSAGTSTLVVAHGAFNRVFLAQALNLPIAAFLDDHFDCCNGECLEMEWSDADRTFRWRRRFPKLSAWETWDEGQARFASHMENPIASKQYEEPGSSKGS